MTRTTIGLRHIGAGLLATASLLLAGCFSADDDDANPIIPAASIAYPLKTGMARECNRQSGNCNRVELVRRPEGGYILRRFETNLLGLAVVKEVPFKLRRLQGTGIPAETFLVQLVDAYPEGRTITLLLREADGRWLQLAPTCDTAIAKDRLDEVNIIFEDNDGVQQCVLDREGLTDQRLFAALRAADDPGYGSRFIEGG